MKVARVGKTELDSTDVVRWLKLTGRFADVAGDLIQEKMTATAARKQGVEVTTEELQAAVENHRRVHGLYRVVDANEFLDAAGATLEDYEAFIEDGLLASKLLDTLVDDAAVEAHFQRCKPDYESVEIGHIVVPSESQAREIIALVNEGESSFQDMAREVSTVDTAGSGGLIGKVYRGTLAEDLESKVFGAKDNDVLGPIALDDGSFEIFSVFTRSEARLDDETRSTIRQRLRNEWLQRAAQDIGVEV
ncbi:MAG: peptidylprolyl isomerase [Pseudomonadota bacterium]